MVNTTPYYGKDAKAMFKDAGQGNVLVSVPFLSESLVHTTEKLVNQGIRGTRSHIKDQDVSGPTSNKGSLAFNPNRALLEMVLAALGQSTIAAAAATNDGSNQIGALTAITGLVLGVTTDSARKFYINVVDDTGGYFHLDMYKASARAAGDKIAHTATYNSTGSKALVADNASGVGGSITLAAVGAADVDIYVTITSMTYSLTAALKQTLAVEMWRGAGGGTYSGGAISKATLSGKSGGLMELALDFIFKSYADLASATTQNFLTGLPYVYSGLVLTLNSQAYRIKDFNFVLDNVGDDAHRNNSVDLQEICAKDRIAKITGTVPESDTNEALEALIMAAAAGTLTVYSLTAVLTAPDSHTVTIAASNVQVPKSNVNIGSREGETDRSFELDLYATTASEDELTVTVTTV